MAAQVAQEEKKSGRLRAQLHETRSEAAESAIEADKLKQQLSGSEAEALEEMKSRMAFFRDPDLKEALVSEAREGAHKNVDSLFRLGLADQLHLNEEQASSLRQLLAQRLSLLSEQIFIPMMTGELDDAAMAASGRTTKQSYEEIMSWIRSLLGDETFAAYEQFEKTESQREAVSRMVSQFADAGQALTAEQQNQWLAAMIDERLNSKFQFDLDDMSQFDFEHWYDNVSDERLNVVGQETKDLNDRLVQRSQTILTPEQAAMFEAFLRERLLKAKLVVQSTKALTPKRNR